LPEGVSTGQCGPRLAACTGLLMAIFAEAKAEHRLASAISCSPIWMVKIQTRVSDAVTVPHEELRGIVAEEKQLVRRRIADRGEQAEGLGCETMPKQTGTALNFGIGLARFSEHSRASEKGCRTQNLFRGILRCLSIVNHKRRCCPVLLVLPAAQPKALARYMLHWVLQLEPFWPVRFKKMRVI
jgi:hypothetical protein